MSERQRVVDRLWAQRNQLSECEWKLLADSYLRAEVERLTGPVCVISDSNYETGQTLWREWFEGGDRKPPKIPTDTALMLTWIVAKFRAELARLKGERDTLHKAIAKACVEMKDAYDEGELSIWCQSIWKDLEAAIINKPRTPLEGHTHEQES